MMFRLTILGLAVGLGACATTQEPESEPPLANALPSLGAVQDIGGAPIRRAITGSCGMEAFEQFVGQPRTNLRRGDLPPNYRVVGLGRDDGSEYRGDRLTIRIDEQDHIESMSCG
jgi:hypothetical protein